MELYDRVIEKLKAMVGPDKYFKNQSELARRCEVDTSLITKHFTGQRGDSFRPFFKILECADVKIIFPYEDASTSGDCSKFTQIITSLEQRLEAAQKLIASQEESLSLYREIHEKSGNRPLKNETQEAQKPSHKDQFSLPSLGQASNLEQMPVENPQEEALHRTLRDFPEAIPSTETKQ